MTDAEIEAVARATWNSRHPLAKWDDADGGPGRVERPKELRAAITAIWALDALRGDGWLPIESAPLETPILLAWRKCTYAATGRYVFDDDDPMREGWKCWGDMCIPRNQEDCTHWMPLPPLPAAPKESTP